MRTIRSKNSHIKFDMIRAAVMAQIAAYRRRHHRRRILLIDGNAGDGAEGQSVTPNLLLQIAGDDGNADVILCEKEFSRRAQLRHRFQGIYILQNNADVPFNVASRHRWALWLSDPCGPSGHGHDAMAALAVKISSDFVIAFNEGVCARWTNSTSPAFYANQERYLMMQHPLWWRRLLKRERLSQTGIYHVAANFRCRIMVVSNHLSSVVSQPPFQVI